MRLSDFLNSKKTVGRFSMANRASTPPPKSLPPLTVRRDFMADANNKTGEDKMDTEPTAPETTLPNSAEQAAAATASPTNPSVSDRITSVEKEIQTTNESIKQVEDSLKLLKDDKSAEAKGTEQELLASLESLKTSKATLELSRDQLVKSGGLEAATVEHILKTSKEASFNNASVKEAVSATLGEIMQELSEEARKKIDHSVATNQDTRDAMTTVVASFVRKRKASSAPEDSPDPKRTKLEERIDLLCQDMDAVKRGFATFTAAATAKTTGFADILHQVRAREDRAKKSAAEYEQVSRQFGGSGGGVATAQPAPAAAAQPASQKPRGRYVSETEVASKLDSHKKAREILAKTTNSKAPH